MFEVAVGHCLECKVGETREASISNMRAFPACIYVECGRAWAGLRVAGHRLAIDTGGSEEGSPLAGGAGSHPRDASRLSEAVPKQDWAGIGVKRGPNLPCPAIRGERL